MTNWLKGLLLFAAGAAVAYLFDPISGRGRRTTLAAMARSRAEDAVTEVATKARYEANRAKGMVYESFVAEAAPESDRELLQKIRSEAVGPTDSSLDYVDIRVEDGVVHLVGSSRNKTAEAELIERIHEVTGVEEVHNELVPA